MAEPDELRAKAVHYRKLATRLDPEIAVICRALAEKCEREASEAPLIAAPPTRTE